MAAGIKLDDVINKEQLIEPRLQVAVDAWKRDQFECDGSDLSCSDQKYEATRAKLAILDFYRLAKCNPISRQQPDVLDHIAYSLLSKIDVDTAGKYSPEWNHWPEIKGRLHALEIPGSVQRVPSPVPYAGILGNAINL